MCSLSIMSLSSWRSLLEASSSAPQAGAAARPGRPLPRGAGPPHISQQRISFILPRAAEAGWGGALRCARMPPRYCAHRGAPRTTPPPPAPRWAHTCWGPPASLPLVICFSNLLLLLTVSLGHRLCWNGHPQICNTSDSWNFSVSVDRRRCVPRWRRQHCRQI